jgi:CubicO group peptidase (beta-lactamase class C family)
MSSRTLVAALIGGIALAPATKAQQPTGGETAIDARAFEFAVHLALENRVMGYSFVLMHRDRIVTEGAGGRARNSADGHMPMRADTPSNMGSLMKFITGVTMLHIFERPPVGSAGMTDGDFRSRLDAPVALLFPQVWQAAIEDPALRGVTFRRYLQHRTGFRDCSGMTDCFSNGFKRRLIGVRSYQNINFSTLGFMIGVYTKPSILQAVNGIPDSNTSIDRDAYFQISAGLQMDEFIREEMLRRVARTVTASCDAANEYRSTAAYAYASVTDTDKGIVTSRKAEAKPCVGSGGYWMSARDFALFAGTALHTDKFLSRGTRHMMSETPDPDGRLVWSFLTSSSTIRSKYGMDPILYSGGDQPYANSRGTHAAIVRLPQQHTAVIFINSNDMNSGALASIAINAFLKGMGDS